jgi:hypothetical protein
MVRATAIPPEPIASFRAVDVRGSETHTGGARTGQTEEQYLKHLGELLTPEIAGSAIVDLTRADPATIAPGPATPHPA